MMDPLFLGSLLDAILPQSDLVLPKRIPGMSPDGKGYDDAR
jgi:hypothetical protein